MLRYACSSNNHQQSSRMLWDKQLYSMIRTQSDNQNIWGQKPYFNQSSAMFQDPYLLNRTGFETDSISQTDRI